MTLTNVALPITLYDYYPANDGPVENLGNPATFDNPQPITAITPNVHDITISDLTATGATAESLVVGVPESCILNVTLNNVNITASNAAARPSTAHPDRNLHQRTCHRTIRGAGDPKPHQRELAGPVDASYDTAGHHPTWNPLWEALAIETLRDAGTIRRRTDD